MICSFFIGRARCMWFAATPASSPWKCKALLQKGKQLSYPSTCSHAQLTWIPVPLEKRYIWFYAAPIWPIQYDLSSYPLRRPTVYRYSAWCVAPSPRRVPHRAIPGFRHFLAQRAESRAPNNRWQSSHTPTVELAVSEPNQKPRHAETLSDGLRLRRVAPVLKTQST